MTRTALALVPLSLALAGCPDSVCEPGDLCTWFGTPQEAGISAPGTAREETKTFWVVDMAFHPVDGTPAILDWNNHRVVTLDENDALQVITGVGGELGDGPPGPALEAQWNHPTDIDWLSDGTLVMAAWHNSRVVTVDPTGSTVEFIAGTGGRGFSGDGGPATDAVLDLPCGIRVDEDDAIYMADMANQRVRVIDPDDGSIESVAGNGEHGFNGEGLGVMETSFASPALQRAEPAFKIDWDLDGTMLIADTHNGRIRRIDWANDVVTTVAGMGATPEDSDNGTSCTEGCGYSGDGGPATEAMLNYPADLAVGDDGTIYIADAYNHCVRAVSPDGTIDTYAGVCGEQGFDGDFGPANEALLNTPFGVEVGPDGAVYISDTYNSRIARVEPL